MIYHSILAEVLNFDGERNFTFCLVRVMQLCLQSDSVTSNIRLSSWLDGQNLCQFVEADETWLLENCVIKLIVTRSLTVDHLNLFNVIAYVDDLIINCIERKIGWYTLSHTNFEGKTSRCR